MSTQEIDHAKAEEFGGQMVGMLNGAMLGLMTSIGHRTGLFDKMASMPLASCEQIASAAGVKERYVREWLSAMVTGQIIEYDPADRTYGLPPEHSASLTRAAGPNNLATLTQFLSLFGNVEDELVECFRKGGGVPYSQFAKFQKLMSEESAQVVDATLIDVTLPLIPGTVERLKQGIDVLDIGCGEGHAINVMARAFPNSRFTGYDFSEEGVAGGQREAKEWNLTNARFVVKDVATIDEPAGYDLITAFDAIHDQAQPTKVLKAIAQALRPGGAFLMVDIAASSNLEETWSTRWAPCSTLSLQRTA